MRAFAYPQDLAEPQHIEGTLYLPNVLSSGENCIDCDDKKSN
jgi:hypothetical protein